MELAIQNIQYSIIYSEEIVGVLITWNLKVICFVAYVHFCASLCICTQVVCSSHVYYIVTHNISSDQSPITVNRTNVTLYGVQPGETYTVTVEITPHYSQSLLLVLSVLKIEGSYIETHNSYF